MISLSQKNIKNIIEKEYPDADNKILANKLGIKEQTLRQKASKLGVKKSERFEENYKDYKMTNIERNIIIGSLLGDGTLSKYGRNLNACYRENTEGSQVPYRSWKRNKLINEIPSMKYKSDIDSKLIDTKIRYSNRFPDKTVNITNKVTIDNSYSKDDEVKIIEMLQNGFSYKDIAEELGRSYHGLYDKVRRMKIEEKI